MQTSSKTPFTLRRKTVAAVFIVVLVLASSAKAQDEVYPPQKPSPPAIDPQVVIMEESVIQTQWTHTLELVNAPQNVSLLNPGECIRVGIYASGDKRDEFLKNTKISFPVQFAGHTNSYPLAFLSAFKKIKPEGGDYVNAALAADGIKEPASLKTRAQFGCLAEPLVCTY